MSEDARWLERLARDPRVTSAALLSDDRPIAAHGVDDVERLATILRAARHLFRSTRPPLNTLHLLYERACVLLVPKGQGVLFIRARADVLLESLLEHVEALPPPSTSAAAPFDEEDGVAASAPFDALNAVLEEAKKSLGGAVIRNYLRRAQSRLAAPELEGVKLGLDGKATPRDALTEFDPALARALGRFTRAFLVEASRVAPELATLDVRAAVGSLADTLEPYGFFSQTTEESRP